MAKHLKIVSVSSELFPFSKTGGLADVAASLPRALESLGHKVICITPLYGQLIDKNKFKLELFQENVKVKIDEENSPKVNFWRLVDNGLEIFFIENEKYFSRRTEIYGSSHENARFLLFDVATLKLLTLLKRKIDVIQCHDWHTGLIPYFLSHDFKDSSVLKSTASIFTIHNLIFQLGHPWWEIAPEQRDDGKNKLPLFNDPNLEKINFAKRGILYADVINTVSETHATEILEREKGQDLHILLRNRGDRLFGIINGIDNDAYNPKTDPGLKANYGFKEVANKKINKLFLQRKYGLTQDADIPLIVTSSRIVHQKGFDLILETLDILLRFNLQIIIMGDGDKDYISQINKLTKTYPQKICWAPFDQKYETSLYAGGDILLLPSTSEPCGINQMKALRYGCIPTVHSVGGLKDTISNFDFNNRAGNGFTFGTYSPLSLYGALVRALEYYKNKKIWNQLVSQSMRQSFSWDLPAILYTKLFNTAIKIKKASSISK
jgi:starch synthase